MASEAVDGLASCCVVPLRLQMWEDLKSQGFNEQLEPVNARGYVISVHSEKPVCTGRCTNC